MNLLHIESPKGVDEKNTVTVPECGESRKFTTPLNGAWVIGSCHALQTVPTGNSDDATPTHTTFLERSLLPEKL